METVSENHRKKGQKEEGKMRRKRKEERQEGEKGERREGKEERRKWKKYCQPRGEDKFKKWRQELGRKAAVEKKHDLWRVQEKFN